MDILIQKDRNWLRKRERRIRNRGRNRTIKVRRKDIVINKSKKTINHL